MSVSHPKTRGRRFNSLLNFETFLSQSIVAVAEIFRASSKHGESTIFVGRKRSFGQCEARQGKARQGKAWHGMAWIQCHSDLTSGTCLQQRFLLSLHTCSRLLADMASDLRYLSRRNLSVEPETRPVPHTTASVGHAIFVPQCGSRTYFINRHLH